MSTEKRMSGDAPMYLWATEMVGAYYQQFNLSGKSVLTVAGSGDQVLNAVFFGARRVCGFDINRNALFMTELKQAAVRDLSYEEFLQFFQSDEHEFGEKSYQKVKKRLSPDARNFFDAAYEAVGSRGLGTSNYFRKRDEVSSKEKLKTINAYLRDEGAYGQLKTLLANNKSMFFLGGIFDLLQNKAISSELFDVINLSNVPNYLTGKSFQKSEADVLFLLEELCTLLAPQGKMFFYSYDDAIYPTPVAQTPSPISQKGFLRMLETSRVFSVEQKHFPGIAVGTTDRVTIMTKRSLR